MPSGSRIANGDDDRLVVPRAHPVKDAIRLLNISHTHFYELVKAKKIRPIKLGGKTIVPNAEIDRLLTEGA